MGFFLRDARIVLPLAAPAPVTLAASELAGYIEKITGARVRIAPEGTQENGPAIFLGDCAANAGVFEASTIYNVRPEHDGFAIVCRKDSVHIAGANNRSVLLGVYRFIADVLGVGFWHCDDEVVDRDADACIRPMELAMRSEVETLQISADYGPSYTSNLVKLGYNAKTYSFEALVAGTADTTFADERELKIVAGGHCLKMFLDEKKYFESHPHWYPLRGGERKPTGHICFADRAAAETLVANGVEMIARAKANYSAFDILSVWPADSGLFCECDVCRAREFNEAYVAVVNDLAEALERARIDVKVEYILYNCDNGYYRKRDLSALALPARRPEKEHADTLFAYWGRCYKTPFEQSEYPEDKRALELLRELAVYKRSSGRRFRMFVYYPDHWMLSSVFPILWDAMAADFRLFKELGCAGLWPCDASVPVPKEYPLTWTKGWASFAMAALAWSSAKDADQLAEEYLKGYYGPHAETARRVIDFFRFDVPAMSRHNLAHPFPGKAGLQAWEFITEITYFYYDPASEDDEFRREHRKLISDIEQLLVRIAEARIKLPQDTSAFAARLRKLEDYREWCEKRLRAVLGQLKAQRAIEAGDYGAAKELLESARGDDEETGSLCLAEYAKWWEKLPRKNPALAESLKAQSIEPPAPADAKRSPSPYG